MNPPLLDLSAQPALAAIGWALVHSLWQIALVAVVAAASLRGLARRPAHVRYAVSCAALALMLALPIGTAVSVYRSSSLSRPLAATASPVASTERPSREGGDANAVYGLSTRTTSIGGLGGAVTSTLEARIEPLLPVLVGAWFIGVALLAARAAGGWWLLRRRVARALVSDTDPALGARVGLLAQRLGFNRAVRAVRSSVVEVPSVAGWLKPLLLVPASALAGLSTAQLDSILAHELAHTRRHDYLFNLVQTAAETLLFYHPATWWISSRIRAAREHCCDDMAVAVSGDVVAYADALARLECMRASRPATLMAADGSRLVERIRRLLGAPDERRDFAWPLPFVVAIALLVTMALVLRFARTATSRCRANGRCAPSALSPEGTNTLP